MAFDKRKISYILPTKIVDSKGKINNLNSLLINKDDQICINEDDCFEIEGPGYIVLDFNQEQAGGIRILTNMSKSETELFNIRIRFGESLSETYSNIGENNATNNHSLRDMEVILPSLSDQSYGDTGFRFVRIDFINNTTYRIKNIYGKCWENTFKQNKFFKSKDDLLNKIFHTSKRTLDLCIQNYIWDGVKRDRLVWIGDMEPEVKSILHLYGNIQPIEDSINVVERSNPLPTWLNGIPTYSFWYLQIIGEVYSYCKDDKFFNRHKKYFLQIINMIEECITNEGTLDFTLSKSCPSSCYFIDWPSSDSNIKDMKNACKNLLIYVFSNLIQIFKNKKNIQLKLIKLHNKLISSATDVPDKKQFLAFHYLVNKDDESYNKLVSGGANGLSTFMSYFILTAIADRDLNLALKIMKEYYGKMLDMGATTFWEDFDILWCKNACRIDELPSGNQKDIHRDFGNYCYKQYRHSLCHGWSCGPVSFLLEHKGKIHE